MPVWVSGKQQTAASCFAVYNPLVARCCSASQQVHTGDSNKLPFFSHGMDNAK